MFDIPKRSLSLIALVTAITTLVAGVPHFVCRCPNGTIKPFCLGCETKQPHSCCDVEVCSTKHESASCCEYCEQNELQSNCCNNATRPVAGSRKSAELSAGGCKRTLAEQKSATLTRAWLNDDRYDSAVAWSFDPKPTITQVRLAVHVRLLPHERPPPTWLDTANRHLLI